MEKNQLDKKKKQHEKAELASSSYSLKEGTMCSMTQGRIGRERQREKKEGEQSETDGKRGGK